MYTKIDVISTAENDAREAVLRDRKLYSKFFHAAEKFAAESGLIVTGIQGRRMLCGDAELNVNECQYEFYSKRGFQQAIELANIVYAIDPEGLSHYTTLNTNVPHQMWTLMVNERPLFTISALGSYQGQKISSLITPTNKRATLAHLLDSVPECTGTTVHSAGSSSSLPVLKCISYELALIKLYQDICDPTQLADLADLLGSECSLRMKFLEGLNPKRDKTKVSCSKVEQILLQKLLKFAEGPGRVVIGQRALEMAMSNLSANLSTNLSANLSTNLSTNLPPLQLISMEPLQNEAAEIVKIAEQLGIDIHYEIQNAYLPGDERLKRLRIVVVPSTDRFILDIYNAAQYELIPLIGNSELSIATPFVVMRFALIDLWFSKVYQQTDFQSTLYLDAIAVYENIMSQITTNKSAINMLVTDEHFVGRIDDADVALKRSINLMTQKNKNSDKQRFFPPYYPAQKHGGSISDEIYQDIKRDLKSEAVGEIVDMFGEAVEI